MNNAAAVILKHTREAAIEEALRRAMNTITSNFWNGVREVPLVRVRIFNVAIARAEFRRLMEAA